MCRSTSVSLIASRVQWPEPKRHKPVYFCGLREIEYERSERLTTRLGINQLARNLGCAVRPTLIEVDEKRVRNRPEKI